MNKFLTDQLKKTPDIKSGDKVLLKGLSYFDCLRIFDENNCRLRPSTLTDEWYTHGFGGLRNEKDELFTPSDSLLKEKIWEVEFTVHSVSNEIIDCKNNEI